MAQVLGIGGVFFKADDKVALYKWYVDVLGVPMESWGGTIFQPQALLDVPGACTVFSPFKRDTDYILPSTKDFMINFVVDDLDGVLARLAAHGVLPTKPVLAEDNGRFAHILDPEGTKLELWQPKPMPT